MRGRDGYDFYGSRLRVELAKGASGRGRGGGGGGGFGGAPPPGFRPRQTGFRVLVKNLPMSASWQDVKVRRAGQAAPAPGWWGWRVGFASHWTLPGGAQAVVPAGRRQAPAAPCLGLPSSPPPCPAPRAPPMQDFIRQVCKPAYTNVFRDRDGPVGVVEFETADDMDRTIRWVGVRWA